MFGDGDGAGSLGWDQGLGGSQAEVCPAGPVADKQDAAGAPREASQIVRASLHI